MHHDGNENEQRLIYQELLLVRPHQTNMLSTIGKLRFADKGEMKKKKSTH